MRLAWQSALLLPVVLLPALVAEAQTCTADVPGILDGTVCCALSCGACGGAGCSGLDGGDFSGTEACCSGGVTALGRTCSATVGAPCTLAGSPTPTPDVTPQPVSPDSMCTTGVPGILSGSSCCPISCGACGGAGCGLLDGGSFSGSEACCSGGVALLERTCSATVGAPCTVAR